MYKYNQKVNKPAPILIKILSVMIYLILIAITFSLLSIIINFTMWVWA